MRRPSRYPIAVVTGVVALFAAGCANTESRSLESWNEVERIGKALDATKKVDGLVAIDAGTAEVHVAGASAVVLSSRGAERAITLRVTEPRDLTLTSMGVQFKVETMKESREPWVATERVRLDPDLSKRQQQEEAMRGGGPFGLYGGVKVRDLLIHTSENGDVEYVCVDLQSLDGEQAAQELVLVPGGPVSGAAAPAAPASK